MTEQGRRDRTRSSQPTNAVATEQGRHKRTRSSQPNKVVATDQCDHPYDLLNILDLLDGLHLCHPPDVLELPDRPDHTTETGKTKTTTSIDTPKRGRPRSARHLRYYQSLLLFSFFLFLLRAQAGQVVPAHQVDDIDETHQVDPVHQVDHREEHTSSMIKHQKSKFKVKILVLARFGPP